MRHDDVGGGGHDGNDDAQQLLAGAVDGGNNNNDGDQQQQQQPLPLQRINNPSPPSSPRRRAPLLTKVVSTSLSARGGFHSKPSSTSNNNHNVADGITTQQKPQRRGSLLGSLSATFLSASTGTQYAHSQYCTHDNEEVESHDDEDKKNSSNHDDNQNNFNKDDVANYHDEQRLMLQQYCQQPQHDNDDDSDSEEYMQQQQDAPSPPAFFAPSMLPLDASSSQHDEPPASPTSSSSSAFVALPSVDVDRSVEVSPPAEKAPEKALLASSLAKEQKPVVVVVVVTPAVRRRSLFFGVLSSSYGTEAAAAQVAVKTPDEGNGDDDKLQEEATPAVEPPPPQRPNRRRGSMFGGGISLLPSSSILGTATAVTPPPSRDDVGAGKQEKSVPAAAPPRPARRRSFFGGTSLLLLPSSVYGGAAATPSNTDNVEREEASVPVAAAAAAAPRPARRRNSIFGGTALLPSFSMHGAANTDERQDESVPVAVGAAAAPPRPARRRSIFGGMQGTGVTPNLDDAGKESSAAAPPQRPTRRRSIFGGMATAFNRATSGTDNEMEEENNGNANNDAAVAPGTAHQQEPEEDYPFIYILKPASRANEEVDDAPRHPALLPKPAKGRFRNTMKRERSNRKLGSSSRSNNNINDQSARSLDKDVSSPRDMNPRPMSESSKTRPPEKDTVADGSRDDSASTNKVVDPPEPQSSSFLEAPPRAGKGRVRKAILKSLAFRPWKRKLLKDDDDGDDPKADGKRQNFMRGRRNLQKTSTSPEPPLQEELCPRTALSPTSTIQERQGTAEQHEEVQGEEDQDAKCLDGPSIEEDNVACFNRSFDDLDCCDNGDDDVVGCLTAASFKEEDIVENKNSFNPLEHFADDDCVDADSFEEETVENEKSVTSLEEYDDEMEEVTVKSGSIIEYYDEETVVETAVEEFEKSLKGLEYEEEELVDFDQEDVFVLSPNGRVRDREGQVIGFSENEWGLSSLQLPHLGNQTLPSLCPPGCRSESSQQEPVLHLDPTSRAGTSTVSNEDDNDEDAHADRCEDNESNLPCDPAVVAYDSPGTKNVSTGNVNGIDDQEYAIVNHGEKPISPLPSPSCSRNKFERKETLSPEQPLPLTSKPEEYSNEHAPDDETIPSPSSKANRFNEIFKGLKMLSPNRQGESKCFKHVESPLSHTLSEPIELHLGSQPNEQKFQCDDEAPPSPTNKANRFHEIFEGLILPSPKREAVFQKDGSVTSILQATPLSSSEKLPLQSPPFCNSMVELPKAQKTEARSRQGSSSPRKKQSSGKPGEKKALRKGQSSDPIRWDLRVRFGSPAWQVYNKPLRHDDCVLVPNFFGPTSDWSLYDKLLVEIRNIPGSNFIPCPIAVGKHLVCPTPMKSKTFKEVCKKVCKYFDIKLETVQFTLNWYRDNTDMQEPRQDEEAYESDNPSTRNITVGISFGAERELSLEKQEVALDKSKKTRISIPQSNNCICTIGRDVNIRFQNGLVPAEKDGGGSIAIILWGQVHNVKEEGGSPAKLKRRDPIQVPV